MIVVALCGLILGRLLNHAIGWQVRDLKAPAAPAPSSLLRWVPLIGPSPQPMWISVAVDALTALMTVVLWQDYGVAPRFWLLLAATVVLINTAAIDWQVKLIDTLIMVGATVLAVAFAPMIIGSWTRSLQGLLAAGIVFLIFFVLAKLMYPRQAAPFGLGDVYLGMFIGALVGLFRVGPALFYGMMLAGAGSIALIVVLGYARARHTPIAYGAFLCLGVLLHLALNPFG